MKVLFLTNKPGTPSTRWRVLQLLPALKKHGVDADVVEMSGGMVGKLGAIRHAGSYDVVVLQKRLLPKFLANRLRSLSKKLVFEFDDSLFLKKTETGVSVSDTRERRFRRILKSVDGVIAANEYLASIARRFAAEPDHVHVLPTAVDLSRWEPRPPARREWPLTIGWMGTAANVALLDIVKQPLVKSCRRHPDLRVKVVCDEPATLTDVKMEHVKFSSEREVEEVRSFDIAIAPLVEDAWTRGKVSTKVLAYFAAGVPTVASNVEAQKTYVVHGETGFLAGTLAEWEDGIEKLLASPDLRDKIGASARAYVERELSLDAVVPKYVELFKKIAE